MSSLDETDKERLDLLLSLPGIGIYTSSLMRLKEEGYLLSEDDHKQAGVHLAQILLAIELFQKRVISAFAESSRVSKSFKD